MTVALALTALVLTASANADAGSSKASPDAGPSKATASSSKSDGGSPASSKTDGGAPTTAVAANADELPPLPQGNIFPYAKKVEKLPNGLTVVMVPFESNGVVAYDTVMRVGSRNEVEDKRSGYAHFFEHMMFKGTKKTPEDKYAATLQKLGVDSNAFTTDDFTLYHNLAAASALPELIELEADRFQNLSYAKEAFQTEAKTILGEYNKNASIPEEKLDEVVHKASFSQHPYRHTTMGFVEDIKAMPSGLDYSKQFFKRFYQPNNATVIIAGDFKPDEVLPLVQKAYASWKGKAEEPKVKTEPPQTTQKNEEVDWPTSTLPRLVLAYHTPEDKVGTKDAAVQHLLGPLLVGPTSPLYRDLVLDKQIVDHMESWYADHRDPDLFTIVITAKNEADLPAIQKAFDAEVADLSAGKVDAQTLHALQLNQLYSALTSFETPGPVGIALGSDIGVTGDPNGLDELYQSIAKVEVSDLVSFAQLYLAPDGRTTATLKAKGGAK
jgi:zinc protease